MSAMMEVDSSPSQSQPQSQPSTVVKAEGESTPSPVVEKKMVGKVGQRFNTPSPGEGDRGEAKSKRLGRRIFRVSMLLCCACFVCILGVCIPFFPPLNES